MEKNKICNFEISVFENEDCDVEVVEFICDVFEHFMKVSYLNDLLTGIYELKHIKNADKFDLEKIPISIDRDDNGLWHGAYVDENRALSVTGKLIET
ncbi:MAG: hypothetical protein AB7S81_03225 [Bdellovibrionales bacterium]